MKKWDDDFVIEYNNLSELSYNDTGKEYIGLYFNNNFVGYIKVYTDWGNDSREYIIINYEIIYLDNLKELK